MKRLIFDSQANLPQGPTCILVRLWNHARIRFLNQPVLINEGKVSCSRKQREHSIAYKLKTDRLRDRSTSYPLRRVRITPQGSDEYGTDGWKDNSLWVHATVHIQPPMGGLTLTNKTLHNILSQCYKVRKCAFTVLAYVEGWLPLKKYTFICTS